MQPLPIPALAPVLEKHGKESGNVPESKGCLCLGAGIHDYRGSLLLYLSRTCRTAAMQTGESVTAACQGGKQMLLTMVPSHHSVTCMLYMAALLTPSLSPWRTEAGGEPDLPVLGPVSQTEDPTCRGKAASTLLLKPFTTSLLPTHRFLYPLVWYLRSTLEMLGKSP